MFTSWRCHLVIVSLSVCVALFQHLLGMITIMVQEKYEEAVAALAEMEERAVMAESMLEATLQYQSGQVKAQASPRSVSLAYIM